MWFGTRTGLPEGALWSTQEGASFIQYSKVKEILQFLSCCLWVFLIILLWRFCVSENQILNVNFVKETQVINSEVQLGENFNPSFCVQAKQILPPRLCWDI